MLDAFLSAGVQVFQPAVLAAMLLALPIGLFVGLLPGISGISALAFLIPFTFGMEPAGRAWRSCSAPTRRCRKAAR